MRASVRELEDSAAKVRMLEADVRTLAETRTRTLEELLVAQQDLKDALASSHPSFWHPSHFSERSH
jgi:hypothetical protein